MVDGLSDTGADGVATGSEWPETKRRLECWNAGNANWNAGNDDWNTGKQILENGKFRLENWKSRNTGHVFDKRFVVESQIDVKQ